MTDLFFEPKDVAQLVRTLSSFSAGARVRLGPGRYLLPESLALSKGIELVGEPGKTVLDGQDTHAIILINAADQTFTFWGLAFENGVGGWGGAISSGSSNRLFVDQCHFVRNRASEDGGAVFLRAAVGSRIVRCRFEMNASKRGGGALDVGHGADVLVDRCLFRANEANVGGAVFLSGTGALELRNCTFLDNRATLERGGGSFFVLGAASSGPSAYVANSIFAGREPIASDPSTKYTVFFTHSIVPPDLFDQPGFQDVGRNTLAVPELVALGEGGWVLAPGAEGAATANAARIEQGATDILGRPLVRDGVADPGALASRWSTMAMSQPQQTVHDFCQGFEGEPELRFVRSSEGQPGETVRLWSGYLAAIMERVKPHPVDGWGGLARPYHLDQGWCEASPWVLDDVEGALRHWRTIDVRQLDPETERVFAAIAGLLARALGAKQKVTIFNE